MMRTRTGGGHRTTGCLPIDGRPALPADREVGLSLEVLERVEVSGGRVARLGACDVEAGNLSSR